MYDELPLPIEGFQQQPVAQSMYDLPIAQPIPVQIPRVVINTAPEPKPELEEILDEASGKKLKPVSFNPFEGLMKGRNPIKDLVNAAAERKGTWIDKTAIEAITGAKSVMDEGTNLGLRRKDYTDIPVPQRGEVAGVPGLLSGVMGGVLTPTANSPQDSIIEKAQAISALAGTGGLAGADATLGATPFLRPALKHKERLYKGKEGQQHQDIIPDSLYNDFQKKAMSGEDLAEYNFGFINEKGQFLSREKALQYGIDTGIIDPSAGKYGALTSTLYADSSKPGTAIEAMAKTRKFDFSTGESSGSKSVKIGPTEITYGVNPKNNDVELSLIRTDKNKRGEGHGRAAIEQFIDEADANGKRVLLNADPMDKSTSKAKLESFYKELGFVRNSGNKKDFSTRAEYIREPVLKADSSKEGSALQANKPAFYSAVEHQVSQINQAKMNGEAWLGTLSNKPGVKPEELDWTGLRSFLEENKGKPVTKAQIEEHLASNKVELKEVEKGNGNLKRVAEDLQKEVGNSALVKRDGGLAPVKLYPDEIEMGLYDGSIAVKDLPTNLQAKAQKLLDAKAAQNDPTKYHSYQLPGGENYREMLLTLPQSKLNKSQLEAMHARERELNAKGKKNLTDAEYTELAEINNKIVDNRVNYKSSHWDEPNILAHVRMNDRIMPVDTHYKVEGIGKDFKTREEAYAARDEAGLAGKSKVTEHQDKKSLHLEEIQSDWHQQGRDKGYKSDANQKLLKEAETKYNKWQAENPDKNSSIWRSENPELSAAVKNSGAVSGVPDAPFKKSWHELALKRMIREAAEKGYDRLSWTPGEAQAARYDLSKHIDTVNVIPSEGSISVTLNARSGVHGSADVDKTGKILKGYDSFKGGEGKSLSDFVGKELSEKILNKANSQPKRPDKLPEGYELIKDGDKWGITPSGQIHARSMVGMHQSKDEAIRQAINHIHSEQVQKNHVLENVDLRIGGEGMKGFYDQIIPKALEKLGKEHGVKVKQADGQETRFGIMHNEKAVSPKEGFTTAKEAREWALSNGWQGKGATVREVQSELPKTFYIDIPTSLKDHAMQKGFPLFAKGVPLPLMPVEGNPFEDKKK